MAWDDIITREQERQVEKVMMREHARLRGDPEGRLSGRSGENDLVIQNAVHNEAFRGHKWYLGFAREADDPRMQVPIQDIPRHAPYCHTAVVEGLALAMPDKEIAQVLIDGADQVPTKVGGRPQLRQVAADVLNYHPNNVAPPASIATKAFPNTT